MLLVTGFLGDEYCDQKAVKPERLIEFFGLPIDLNSRKPRVVFRMVDSLIKKDRLNGGTKNPAGWYSRTVINGEFQGQSLTIQYADKKVVKGNGPTRETVYEPHLLPFIGKAVPFFAHAKDMKDLEKVVFYMLHPKCEGSPLAGSEARNKMIKLDDSVKEAANKVSSLKSFMDVYNQVLNMPISELRTKLAGLKKGLNVESLEDVEVEAMVSEMMQANPSDFLNKWNSHTVTFEGIMNRAIQLGAIEQYALGGGIQAWRFSRKHSKEFFDSDAQVPITQVAANQTPMEALKAWALASANNLGSIQSILTRADQATKLDEILGPKIPDLKPAKIGEMSLEQMIEHGLANDQLGVVKEEGQWQAYFMKGGDTTDKITDISSYPNRVEELKIYFTNDPAAAETLKNKVKGSLMQAAKKAK